MDAAAKLIVAIGTLLGAIAWPAVIFVLALIFRKEIRSLGSRIPSLLDRVRKMKIAGIEADLDRIADASGDTGKGQITPIQIEAAAKIASDADQYSVELLNQLDRLGREYDSIRRTMPSSLARTQAMTRVVVKMRALAPSLLRYIDIYKGSGSPGSRLAAVAMMQMDPAVCDLFWLADRFKEEQPFIFYHAALALQNYANRFSDSSKRLDLLRIAEKSLETVLSFKGTPDYETVEILEHLIDDIHQ